MRQLIVIAGIIIAALLAFHSKVGFQKVATNNDEWLLIRTTDRLPDYLAFRYFHRVEMDQLPDTLNYGYPQRVSPIYTNVTPLISYPLKWLGMGDAEKFQIFGIWFLSCFLLQGIFAYLFLRALKIQDLWSVFLGSCFFILSVPMMFRLDHPTLVHHWTVIAGLIPFFTQWKNKFAWMWYLILALISSTTHPYMLPFGSGLPVFYGLHQWVKRGRLEFWDIVIPLSSIGLSLLLLWLMGAFGFDVSTAAGGGFGYYSANLNTFYNNFGLTNAPLDFETYHQGAYEGLAYLGLGMLLLLIANLAMYWNYRKKLRMIFSRKWIVLSLGVLAFTFFAFSDVWTFHEMRLVSWPDDWGEEYFGIFRSSGRYIWPMFYLLMGLIIYGWTRLSYDKRLIRAGLLIALLIQLWDVYPFMTERIPDDSRVEEFTESNWKEIMPPFDKIITYPPYQRTLYESDDVSHLIYLASFNAIPITAGHLPRPDEKAQGDLYKSLSELFEGVPDSASLENYRKTLFVTTMGYLPKFRPIIEKDLLKVRKVGNYMLLIHTEMLDKHAEVFNAYTRPAHTSEITHLEDWLDQYVDGSFIIVGQDEVTSHPGPGFLEWMENKGSQFNQVRFRDAYFARFKNGALIEEKWGEKVVQDTFFTGNDHWIVRSEGNKAGNESYIIVNGEKFDQLSRGLNIFHITGKTDSITYVHFDTYLSDGMQQEQKLLIKGERN